MFKFHDGCLSVFYTLAVRAGVKAMWDTGMRTQYKETFQFDQLSDDLALTINIHNLVDPKGNKVEGPEIK